MNKKNENQKQDAGEVKTIKIKDIVINEELYPRFECDDETVKSYAENIDILPPIKINQDNILTDGMHRLEAFKLSGKIEIECITIKTKDDKDLFRMAVELNAKHGKQLSYKDKKRVALKLYDFNNSEELIQMLSVSKDCFNKWTRNLKEKKREAFENDMLQDYLNAENTIQQIAEKYKRTDKNIRDIINETEQKINLLSVPNPQELLESYPKNLQKKIIKDFTDIDENKDKLYTTPNLLKGEKYEFPERLKKKYSDISSFELFSSDIWQVYKPNTFDTSDTVITDNSKLNKSILFYFTKPFGIVYCPDDKSIINDCKTYYRRYLNGDGIIATPTLAYFNNVGNIESKIQGLCTKMKEGYIAVIVQNLNEEKSINDLMYKKGLKLERRIIIPINQKTQKRTLTHSYSSLLVFSVE